MRIVPRQNGLALQLSIIIAAVLLKPVQQHNTQSSNKNTNHQRPQTASIVTMDKRAQLSGIRIEPEEQGGDGFIGYAKQPSEKGVSIVEPDTPVRVVLFGSFLDEIDTVGFTNTENCTNTLRIGQNDFAIQSERRIVIIYEFEKSAVSYKPCIRQKPNANHPKGRNFSVVDDRHCMVSTDMPAREYYFPMPIQIAIIVFLLVLSGLFSGLNLGLMSLTPQELTLISNSGSPKERKYAQTILPVRKSGNLLLCSLLIGNVCVNSAISILFDDLTSGYVALAVSSAGIVVFGEIFPQALCVKKGLAVGSHTIWITRFFMVLTFPLAYPISRALDVLLGDQVESYDRKRLIELIKLNTKNAVGPAEELKIAIGAFEMGDKTVKDVMTKIDDVFMIPHDTVLNAKVVAEIVRSGYTRIPVFSDSRNNVVSLLFVKDLALLDPDDNFIARTVCEYYQHPVRRVPENTPLRTMLEEFKKGDYHMALVDRMVVAHSADDKDSKYELAGLVTLEDIVEEILQAEIVDETDVVMDNVNRIKRRRNQRRDLQLFIDDSETAQISMQMQLVTIQFLEGTFRRAFHPDRIAQSILEKVIRAHVHKVEVSHLADFNDPRTALPRKARLYVKEKPSDKFILILEGRALITIGQGDLTFGIGPWEYFGSELLQQLDQLIEAGESGSPFTPATVPAGTTTVPQPPIRTVTSAAGGIDRASADSRQSQGAITGLLPSGVQQQHPMVDLSMDVVKKVLFIPDFSISVLSECTYLEISVQTYLSMYRTTQITRNKEGIDVTPATSGTTVSGGATTAASATDHHQHPSVDGGGAEMAQSADHHQMQRLSLHHQQQQQSPTETEQRRHSTLQTDGHRQSKQELTGDEQQPLLTNNNGPMIGGAAMAGSRQKRTGKFLRAGSNASAPSGGAGGLFTNGALTVAVSLDEEEDDTDEEDAHSHDAGDREGEENTTRQKQQQRNNVARGDVESNYLPFPSSTHH
uniref:Metal transporter CNNM2 n=1 Tax=Globodera rostochiensis TaxID=31243 RepID=A0A914HM24_GLORO